MGVEEKEGVVFLEEEGGENAGEEVLSFLADGGFGEATSSLDSPARGFALLSDTVRIRGAFVAVEGCLVKSVSFFLLFLHNLLHMRRWFPMSVQTTSFGLL